MPFKPDRNKTNYSYLFMMVIFACLSGKTGWCCEEDAERSASSVSYSFYNIDWDKRAEEISKKAIEEERKWQRRAETEEPVWPQDVRLLEPPPLDENADWKKCPQQDRALLAIASLRQEWQYGVSLFTQTHELHKKRENSYRLIHAILEGKTTIEGLENPKDKIAVALRVIENSAKNYGYAQYTWAQINELGLLGRPRNTKIAIDFYKRAAQKSVLEGRMKVAEYFGNSTNTLQELSRAEREAWMVSRHAGTDEERNKWKKRLQEIKHHILLKKKGPSDPSHTLKGYPKPSTSSLLRSPQRATEMSKPTEQEAVSALISMNSGGSKRKESAGATLERPEERSGPATRRPQMNLKLAEEKFKTAQALMAKDDHKEAVKYLREAAATGSINAQYHLGKKLLKGHGIEKDIPKGLHHMQIAALGGIQEAKLFLADINLRKGTPQSILSAWGYLEQLRKTNMMMAGYLLAKNAGKINANGGCVNPDITIKEAFLSLVGDIKKGRLGALKSLDQIIHVDNDEAFILKYVRHFLRKAKAINAEEETLKTLSLIYHTFKNFGVNLSQEELDLVARYPVTEKEKATIEDYFNKHSLQKDPRVQQAIRGAAKPAASPASARRVPYVAPAASAFTPVSSSWGTTILGTTMAPTFKGFSDANRQNPPSEDGPNKRQRVG